MSEDGKYLRVDMSKEQQVSDNVARYFTLSESELQTLVAKAEHCIAQIKQDVALSDIAADLEQVLEEELSVLTSLEQEALLLRLRIAKARYAKVIEIQKIRRDKEVTQTLTRMLWQKQTPVGSFDSLFQPKKR